MYGILALFVCAMILVVFLRPKEAAATGIGVFLFSNETRSVEFMETVNRKIR